MQGNDPLNDVVASAAAQGFEKISSSNSYQPSLAQYRAMPSNRSA
jgi:hypothetical protein